MSATKSPLSGTVNLPLSGAVNFAPWINITADAGQSSNPSIEIDALAYASYGKQLGRIGDALIVLLNHFIPHDKLSSEERDAIRDLKSMLNEIAGKKEAHSAKQVLRPGKWQFPD